MSRIIVITLLVLCVVSLQSVECRRKLRRKMLKAADPEESKPMNEALEAVDDQVKVEEPETVPAADAIIELEPLDDENEDPIAPSEVEQPGETEDDSLESEESEPVEEAEDQSFVEPQSSSAVEQEDLIQGAPVVEPKKVSAAKSNGPSSSSSKMSVSVSSSPGSSGSSRSRSRPSSSARRSQPGTSSSKSSESSKGECYSGAFMNQIIESISSFMNSNSEKSNLINFKWHSSPDASTLHSNDQERTSYFRVHSDQGTRDDHRFHGCFSFSNSNDLYKLMDLMKQSGLLATTGTEPLQIASAVNSQPQDSQTAQFHVVPKENVQITSSTGTAQLNAPESSVSRIFQYLHNPRLVQPSSQRAPASGQGSQPSPAASSAQSSTRPQQSQHLQGSDDEDDDELSSDLDLEDEEVFAPSATAGSSPNVPAKEYVLIKT